MRGRDGGRERMETYSPNPENEEEAGAAHADSKSLKKRNK